MGNINYRNAARNMPTPLHQSESIENVERGMRSCVRVWMYVHWTGREVRQRRKGWRLFNVV